MVYQDEVLGKSVQKVQEALTEKGFPFKVKEYSLSTRTALEAASAIGCTVGQIVKSLLFRSEETSEPILILVSGSNRVNEKKIAQLIGQKILKAEADFAREMTGFAIGGIPPVGHKQKINHVFIDEDLLQYEIVWAAAGTPNAVFSLFSSDLETLTQGKMVSVK